MFFVVSKLFWLLAEPLNLAILLLLLAVVLRLLHRRRAAWTLVAAVAFGLAVAAWTNLGALMLRPLEDRFPPPPAPAAVAGIVVLGGATDGSTSLARGSYQLNDAAERLVEAAVLARRYPEARIVLSGGVGALIGEGEEEDAVTSEHMLTALGVAAERLVIEKKSRNTYENAVLTKALVRPQPGEVWLLVTSAYHMPRSVALFRKAGMDVVAWPVDYRTTGREGLFTPRGGSSRGLANLSTAIHEWIGLLAYRLAGKIDSVFPAPAGS